ncbi:MAG: CHAD domain-containing protein [Myxococcales bacterium]|nr:MAG: CHAD domain-containing protein [Myxococcales bacterium]
MSGERRYPAPVIAVSNPASEQAPAESAPVPKRPERKRPNNLPADLLFRSDEEAARRLALKALSAARAAERRLDDRSDPEALHDFRVAVRRLRSLLRAYKPQLQSAVRKKDRNRLREIQRATGGGREAEVALEWLTKQQRDLAPEHLTGLNWLSAKLLARRRECAQALDGELRESFKRTAEKLEERLAIMRSEQNLLAERPHVSFARTLANLTESHGTDLLVQLGQIARMDDSAALHEARIMAKRLRYLLEPVRAFVDDAQPVVKKTKRLQDVLGDLNDVHVLMDEIDAAFEDALAHKAGRIKESLGRGDLERARRDASMSEWVGLVELYSRLENERRELIAKLRDRWLDGELDALVSRTRNLAHDLRMRDHAPDAQ